MVIGNWPLVILFSFFMHRMFLAFLAEFFDLNFIFKNLFVLARIIIN